MNFKKFESIKLTQIKSLLYFSSILSVMIILLFSDSESKIRDTEFIVNNLASFTKIPNTVTSVILGTRLFDTIGEVTVFTLAGLGVKILLSEEASESDFKGVKDSTIIQLLDFSAILCAFLSIELAIRGHLTPGGGFASGVAGATAITLLMITGRMQKIEEIYFKFNVVALEKFAVILFIFISLLSFSSFLFSNYLINLIPQLIYIPMLNIICALKVTLGTWSIIRLFILKRGLFT